MRERDNERERGREREREREREFNGEGGISNKKALQMAPPYPFLCYRFWHCKMKCQTMCFTIFSHRWYMHMSTVRSVILRTWADQF